MSTEPNPGLPLAQRWYRKRGDERDGPWPSEQLLVEVSAGRIGPDDLVKTDRMEDWVPAKSVNGLDFPPPTAPQTQPPPLPAKPPPLPPRPPSLPGGRSTSPAGRRRPLVWGYVAAGLIVLTGGLVIAAGLFKEGFVGRKAGPEPIAQSSSTPTPPAARPEPVVSIPAATPPQSGVPPAVTAPATRPPAEPPTSTPSVLARLSGTKWLNGNGVSFEWMSDGKFRHEGVERPCKEGGPFAVEIDFGGGNTARLVFDKGLTRFDQYDGGERLLFTGRRTDGDQNKPAAGRSELAVGESAVLRGHAGYVWSAAFSGDGKRLVSVGQHGPVILWDVATRSKVWAAEVAGDLRAAAFISAGRQIAVQKAGGLVVLSAGSGEVEDESRFPANGWGRFSPDGRHLALTTVNDSKSRIHSVPSGRVEYEHPAKYATSQRGYVFPTNDGCFAGLNEVFRLSLVARPSILPTKIKQQTIEAMDVSPDGMRLVTGSGRVWVDRLKKDVQGDNCVRVWDVATGRLLAALKGHDGWLWSVCYHPDGKRVLSGGSGRAEPLDFYGHQPGADTSLRLWDVATQRELRRFDGHSAAVLEIKCSPDGRYAATGSADGTVRLWRLPD